MTRKVLSACLLIVAICAAHAVVASSAVAFFDVKAPHANIIGTQTNNHVLTTSVGTVSCKKTTLAGTVLGDPKGDGYWTSEDLTLHAESKECTAFGFGATVTTTGCDTTYTRTGLDPENTPTGTIHILCEAGKKIQIVAAGFCTMEIGAQTPGGHVVYHNKNVGTASEDIEITTTLEGIKYEGNCGSGTNGKATGNTTLQATTTAGEPLQAKVT